MVTLAYGISQEAGLIYNRVILTRRIFCDPNFGRNLTSARTDMTWLQLKIMIIFGYGQRTCVLYV